MKNRIRIIILCACCVIVGVMIGCAAPHNAAQAKSQEKEMGEYLGKIDDRIEVYRDNVNHKIIYRETVSQGIALTVTNDEYGPNAK